MFGFEQHLKQGRFRLWPSKSDQVALCSKLLSGLDSIQFLGVFG